MTVAGRTRPKERDLRSLAFGAPVVGIVPLKVGFGLAIGDGSVRFLATDGPISVAEPHDGTILSAVAGPNGTGLLTGGDDGRVMHCQPDGLTELVAEAPGFWIDHVAASAASGALAWNAGRMVHLKSADGRPHAWAAPSTPGALLFDRRGRRLAVAHYGGVSLWLPKSDGETVRKLDWKGSHIALTWSADGKYIVTGMQENSIHGWRLADGAEMRMSGYSGKPRSMSWSRDNKWLATSGAPAVVIWPFSAGGPWGKAPDEIGLRKASVTQAAFHPRRNALACGYSDGCAVLFLREERTEMELLAPTGAPVNALAWDRSGLVIMSGSEGGSAHLIDLSRVL